MARIVMKFGGSSVADIERIRAVARRIKAEVDAGNEVAVAVSAMAGVTNQLVGYVDETARLCDLREFDVVISSGEQVTAGLLAIALFRTYFEPSPLPVTKSIPPDGRAPMLAL